MKGRSNDSTQISAFLEDARRFVLANRYIADIAPLQLYSSALLFAPQTSIVRNTCGQIPRWIRRCPITPKTWGPELQKLEGHTSGVTAVAFSQDGLLLASASYDHTVRLWNPTTGQEVQKLKGHTSGVHAVAFSQDGLLLASASYDHTVRLWNPTTGQEVQKLEGHTSWVNAVAFSQHGLLLASASNDRTVRLWNPTTGQEIKRLEDMPVIRTISPTHDNMTWFTDRGILNIDEGSVSAQAPQLGTDHSMMLMHDWIRLGTRKLLWLPQEYRSDATSFRDNTFGIGRRSGQVTFIELDDSLGVA